MKVYQINVVCGSGSTGRIAVAIGENIKKNNGQCRIAYGRGNAPADVDSFLMTGKIQVYFHAFMARLFDKQGTYSKNATKRLIADIENYQPDIIQLHNIHGYYLNYELLFSFLKSYQKPVVWTMHDCWAFTGHCAHYESVGCDKWQKRCMDCPNLTGYPAAYYSGNVGQNYDKKQRLFTNMDKLTIVTPSRWLKEQVSLSFFKAKETIVIPNGINLDIFKPTDSDIKKKLCQAGQKLLLGVTGTWTKNKGLDDFIKLRSVLGEDYVICLVGVTKKQREQLPEGIIGVERTESVKELAGYYTAADLFLNLTYEDTFPTTNMEAIACGTPVLTYKTGGSSEMVDEACGFVVEKGDVTKVADVLRHQLHGKEDYAAACADRALHFKETDCYRKYAELYEDILRE